MIRANKTTGGAGVVSISSLDSGTIASNGTKTVTIDASKAYVVSMCRKYTFTSDETILDIWKIEQGSLSQIVTASASSCDCSLSGTTLTLTGDSNSYSDYDVAEIA